MLSEGTASGQHLRPLGRPSFLQSDGRGGSSVGQSRGLLTLVSRVRILPAPPTMSATPPTVAEVDVVELDGPGGRWRVLVPRTRRERMRGLRGHPPPGLREGLLLLRCRSVHTVGMRDPIVVARLDRNLTVRGVTLVRPWRLVLPSRGGRHVLECGIDARLRIGDGFRRPAGRPVPGPRRPRRPPPPGPPRSEPSGERPPARGGAPVRPARATPAPPGAHDAAYDGFRAAERSP